MDRNAALSRIKTLTAEQRAAVVWLVENQEAFGDWYPGGEDGSVWDDNVSDTLNAPARTIKEAT